MKKLPDLTASIYLDSTGEVTGEKYIGQFRVKRVLTNADRFAIEREYLEMLPSGNDASEEVRIRAATIAELSVRILSGPTWWNGSSYGKLLLDTNPVYDLMAKCHESYKDWVTQLKQSAVVGEGDVQSRD